jgi:hypothetical protein
MDRKFKVFIKKTRKGQVRKVVREHYLRDDILTEPDGGWVRMPSADALFVIVFMVRAQSSCRMPIGHTDRQALCITG